MGLSRQEQLKYWGIAAVAFVALLWLLGNTLLPFVTGAAIAYLLNPSVRALSRHGFDRVAATALITAIAVLVLVLILLVLVPFLADQIDRLVSDLPAKIAALRDALGARFPALFDENSTLRQGLAGMEESLRSGGLAVVKTVLTSSLAVFNSILVVVLAPVVAFYLLMDWDRMMDRIDDLVPREHLGTVRSLGSQVDEVLSGFVRGQLLICVMLGTFYALSLALLGLQFGPVVGAFAGLISFIPFVGSILGGLTSIGLALFQFWGEWPWVAAVAAVFIAGQVVEGNVLTPRVVGDKVRLHPVWLIFALAAFGSLFGFVGLLIAVPVAAVLGVLSRFAIAQYKDGPLYTGRQEDPGPGPARDAAE